ncbi:hypothetical protein ABIA39_003471 [Nocardia sp. GAS34]|uniref:DUF4262 domain-containing protein n=1 Tax=unclassified Nocardia TaxID=2637762 RepID=UPI003D1E48E5
MCWLCPYQDRTLADYLTEVETIVANKGWHIQSITESPNSFPIAYTVGLTLQHRPELVITGLPNGRAADILTAAVQLPATLTAPGLRMMVAGQPVETVAVLTPTPGLFVAEALYGPNIEAVQLVHPNRDGSWPWDPRYSGHQPLLGLPAH